MLEQFKERYVAYVILCDHVVKHVLSVIDRRKDSHVHITGTCDKPR